MDGLFPEQLMLVARRKNPHCSSISFHLDTANVFHYYCANHAGLFDSKRGGFIYGEVSEGGKAVVRFIYEPVQEPAGDGLVISRNRDEEVLVEGIAKGLGLIKLGFIFTKKCSGVDRGGSLSREEILMAAEMEVEAKKDQFWVSRWVNVVVKLEVDEDGGRCVNFEAFELSDVCIRLYEQGNRFDPRGIDLHIFMGVVEIFDDKSMETKTRVRCPHNGDHQNDNTSLETPPLGPLQEMINLLRTMVWSEMRNNGSTSQRHYENNTDRAEVPREDPPSGPPPEPRNLPHTSVGDNEGTSEIRSQDYTVDELIRFVKIAKPHEFSGSTDPVQACRWLRKIENVLNAVECKGNKRTKFAAFMLSGQAWIWWESIEEENRGAEISWEEFQKVFKEKYFPKFLQYEFESKFLELRQGDMSVSEYESKFLELSCFAEHQANSDERMAKRFEYGLNPLIRNRIMEFGFQNYADLVKKALMVEDGGRALGKKRKGKMPFQVQGNETSKIIGKKRGCYRCGKQGHISKNCTGREEFTDSNVTNKDQTWTEEIEEVLEASGCNKSDTSRFINYMLKVIARSFWWKMIEHRNDEVRASWIKFQEMFIDKHFTRDVRYQLEFKFLELIQGNMDVAEYVYKFEELATFAPYQINTAERRARRFVYGLDWKICSRLLPLKEENFDKLLDRAQFIEYFQESKASEQDECEHFEELEASEQDEQVFKKRATCRVCYKCGRAGHIAKHCGRQARACYRCGQEGHIAKSCRQVEP